MSGTAERILRRIRAKGRGSVWTPKQFLDLGSRTAVGRALRRLAQKGVLQRLGRGVYSYPRVSPQLGSLTPSPDAIAEAVARGTGSKLQVSGARAANVLGLSRQVPSRSVYLTDGPSRTIQVGRQTIQLRHVPESQLYGAGTRAGLALQALRYLGAEGVDARVVRRLRAQLDDADKRILRRGARQVPEWMRPVVDQIAASG